jgi:hypothetical protein
MKLWKITCKESNHPGMWQRWFRNQCVSVGWYSKWGYYLTGKTKVYGGWNRVRKVLQEIQIGDYIVVALERHCVGRLGQVTGKAIDDTDWDPLVPPTRDEPDGGMGRRIMVRWDLTVGPEDRDTIVSLPEGSRFTLGELRPTLSEIRSVALDQLKEAMNNQANWITLGSRFDYESTLSGYIASYPHKLEDGLTVHPSEKVREHVFNDKSRSDVLLLDRNGVPVIVECKQNQPTVEDLHQLRHYMKRLRSETGQNARGIIIHGGARKVGNDVLEDAKKKPQVELVRYSLDVDFSISN